MTQQGTAGSIALPPQDPGSAGMKGSIQALLAENLGQYVECEFLIGTDAIARKCGILYAADSGYVVLYDETLQTYVVGDAFALRFVTIRPVVPATDVPPTLPEAAVRPETAVQPETAAPAPQATPAPAPQATPTPAPEPAPTPAPEPLSGVQLVNARAQSQAAFNYAKRKARI